MGIGRVVEDLEVRLADDVITGFAEGLEQRLVREEPPAFDVLGKHGVARALRDCGEQRMALA